MITSDKRIEISIEKRRAMLLKREKECEEILSKYRYNVPSPSALNKINHTVYSIPKQTKASSSISALSTQKKKYVVKFNKNSHHAKKTSTLSIIKDLDTPNKTKSLTFNDYLQMQTKAELKLRPVKGDTSHSIVNYLKKISPIRKQILEKDIEPIMQTEDRFNSEIPEKDTKIDLEDKSLIEHLWKNYFTLKDYQNFFLDELKGKISKLNYRIMLKKFRQINHICFCHGTVNTGAIKYMLGEDY